MARTAPPERTPFFEFQARNRRATWRLTLAYVLVVGGGGFRSAVGFVANLFLVLFALVFVPAIACLGLGALAMLSPVTAPLTEPLWTVGLLWRSRRYLAAATSVELTRNPTGLYRGLRRLGESGARTPGGGEVAHLFIVGPEGDRKGTFAEREGLLMGMHPALERRLARLERMGVRP